MQPAAAISPRSLHQTRAGCTQLIFAGALYCTLCVLGYNSLTVRVRILCSAQCKRAEVKFASVQSITPIAKMQRRVWPTYFVLATPCTIYNMENVQQERVHAFTRAAAARAADSLGECAGALCMQSASFSLGALRRKTLHFLPFTFAESKRPLLFITLKQAKCYICISYSAARQQKMMKVQGIFSFPVQFVIKISPSLYFIRVDWI